MLDKQQVRFLIAGCVNTAIDFLLLNVMTLALGAPVLLANTVSVLFGIVLSYVLNHFFVFRYPEPVRIRTFLTFFAVTGFSSLVLQNVVIWLFEGLFGTTFGRSLLFLGDEAGNAILAINVAKAAAVLVGLIWNFAFYRLVIFRPKVEASVSLEPDAALSAPAPRPPQDGSAGSTDRPENEPVG